MKLQIDTNEKPILPAGFMWVEYGQTIHFRDFFPVFRLGEWMYTSLPGDTCLLPKTYIRKIP